MRRWVLVLVGVGAIAAAAACYVLIAGQGDRVLASAEGLLAAARPPIVVGILYSQAGPMAISERSLIDAEVLALEEVNLRGGIDGRPVRWAIGDGRSDPSTFAAEARRLIEAEKVCVIFGCYTADDRKAVRAVVEQHGSILFLAANFEGMEPSARVIHAGGSANQSVGPSVRWAVDTLKARRFYLAGSDELWSRSALEIARDAVKASGGEVVGESFLPVGGSDVGPMVEAIRASRADAILGAIVGDSNVPFYRELRRAGLTPDKVPVISYSVGEDEVRAMAPGDVAGHYSAWNYFQSLDRDENRAFVRRFRGKYGESRVTGDAIVAAYDGVMLWAQAANEAGTVAPRTVFDYLGRQSLNAPDGIISIDSATRIVWRPFHVGRARADGQFDIVWSIDKPIHPLLYTPTRTRAQWRAFVAGIRGRPAPAGGSTGPPPAPAPPR